MSSHEEKSAVIGLVSSWLDRPARELDETVDSGTRTAVASALRTLGERRAHGDQNAFYQQQLLLSRIYALGLRLPEKETAEGSAVLAGVTRMIEDATIEAEDARVPDRLIDEAPDEPKAFLSWIKDTARRHRAFKHPYYSEFIRNDAGCEDIRSYVIQESVIDSRFDDLLAMMQVGTNGGTKMEIAQNFWDEMGNGDDSQVHTSLFDQIFTVFDISAEDFEEALTAEALLSGNLVYMLCRYRQFFPEAVGFLGMTEWLVPDRFVNVLHAWQRLGLPPSGIAYHRLHVTVDAGHAAGWFRNVVLPHAGSPFMRRGIARGAIWRLNSSARHLDERLAAAGAS
jgi:hypothetical protein